MSECLDKQSITDYVSGQLPPEDKLRLNKHISACPTCKAAVLAEPAMVRGAAIAVGGLEKACSRRAVRSKQEVVSSVRRQNWWITVPVGTALLIIVALLGSGWFYQRSHRSLPSPRIVHVPASVTAPSPVAKTPEKPRQVAVQPPKPKVISSKPAPRTSSLPGKSPAYQPPGPPAIKANGVLIAVVNVNEDQASELDEAVRASAGKALAGVEGILIADARITSDLADQIQFPVVRGSEDMNRDKVLARMVAQADSRVRWVMVWKIEQPRDLTTKLTLCILDKKTGSTLYTKTSDIAATELLGKALEEAVQSSTKDGIKHLLAAEQTQQ